MNTNITAAPADKGALTPIEALDAIYRAAELDMNALQAIQFDAGKSASDDLDRTKDEARTAELARWDAVREIPRMVLLERPTTANDIRLILSWLSCATDAVLGEMPESMTSEPIAKAAAIAIDNLSMVLVPMLGLEPVDEFGIIRQRFDLRYNSAKTEG